MNIWIYGFSGGQSMLKNVSCDTMCEDIYNRVSDLSGVPSSILTLSNGVKILQRNKKLCIYTSQANIVNGLSLQCYIKNLGGNGDDVGKNGI